MDAHQTAPAPRAADLAGQPLPVLVGVCPVCGGEAVFRYWEDDDGHAWSAGACLREDGCWWSEVVKVETGVTALKARSSAVNK